VNVQIDTIELHVSSAITIGSDSRIDRLWTTAQVADWADEHAGERIAWLWFVSVPFDECNGWDECDADSGDLEAVASALWKNNGDWRDEFLEKYGEAWTGERVLILDRAQLEEDFRGHGLGAIIIGHAIKQLRAGVSIVACYPYPIDKDRADDDSEEADAKNRASAAKIAKVYESIGFEDWRNGVWVLDMNSELLDKKLAGLQDAWN
jgi:GNAT superfamily N-acetyltransferase